MLTYKGYSGHAEYDDEAGLFHGEVLGIRDVVTFQGTSVAELRDAFRESVEDYLDMCASRGVEPNKPFSGKFMIRLDPNTHRRAAIAAKSAGKSLNAWAAMTLEQAANQAD
jgi:predicted HicB family RNase H-like nuclease